MNMQISSEGLEVLKNREKLRLTAYKDSGGVWTIGYGCTTYENGNKVKAGDVITEAKALQLLAFHVGKAAAAVNAGIKSVINQGQFDALTSFTYNVGTGAFAKSHLRVLVNTNPNDFDSIEAEFLRWVYDENENGVKVVVAGLVNRRKEEIEMYRNGSVKKKLNGSGLRQRLPS
ncbi:lysozyme [Dyadobacter sediminis]|uniref:Lysozyme n=1 Tax=Dyadobacter sediminis TaxID=1493691 RepID=A0A5R9KB34_9BACT|nr:lysozyme [Dyadobacter sediminis]TLU91984.1 lysozyme [Dyadobacter sediminis]GGB98501.1 hypothetical protein GCM10011325_27210 [Dyadobacter sediminis]